MSAPEQSKIFDPSEPRSALDEKAASLEETVQRLTADFKRERFVHIFISVVLFDGLMIAVGSQFLAIFFITCSVLILLGLARWLDFPWISVHLERWHGRFERLWDRWLGVAEQQIEPPPSTGDLPAPDPKSPSELK